MDPIITSQFDYDPEPDLRDQALISANNSFYMAKGLVNVSRSKNPLVLAFHDRARVIMTEECQSAVQALVKLRESASVILPEVLRARMAGLANMATLALQARLQNAAVPLVRVIEQARTIVDASMDRQPKDANAAVLWFLRVADVRRQLDKLPLPSEVHNAALKLAERADETWVEVFLNSVTTYLQPEARIRLTMVYQQAYAADQVTILNDAKDAMEEVKATISMSKHCISVALSEVGLNFDWSNLQTFDIVKGWPKPTKAAFIAANGERAYTALLSGQAGLDTALGFFRPGLKITDYFTGFSSDSKYGVFYQSPTS